MNLSETYKGIRASLLGYDPGFMKLYCRYIYKPKPNTLAEALDRKLETKKYFQFLQIGGNDGYINDPIYKFIKRYPSKGIIAEPQKEVFNRRLKRTYKGENYVYLENVAIAQEEGFAKLYQLAISNSRWATGLASFDKKVLEYQITTERVQRKARKEGVFIPVDEDTWIKFEEVICTTLASLLDKHSFSYLDLLQIDTEGYDYEIIKSINFNQLKIDHISYEQTHLSMNDRKACQELLRSQNYDINIYGEDVLASRTTP